MKAKQTTTPMIQKLFIAAAVTAWIVQALQVLVIAAMQYPSNPNMSGLVPWFLFSFGVPLVLIGIVYASKRNKGLNLQNVFEVAVVSVSILFVFVALSSLLAFAPMSYLYNNNGSVLFYQLITTALPLTVAVLIFVVALYRLRRSGQW